MWHATSTWEKAPPSWHILGFIFCILSHLIPNVPQHLVFIYSYIVCPASTWLQCCPQWTPGNFPSHHGILGSCEVWWFGLGFWFVCIFLFPTCLYFNFWLVNMWKVTLEELLLLLSVTEGNVPVKILIVLTFFKVPMEAIIIMIMRKGQN